MQRQELKEEEFGAWLHLPITKIVLQYLKDYREDLKEALVAGRYSNSDYNQSAALQKYGEVIGSCYILGEMENLSFEDIRFFYEGEKEEVTEVTTD